jgi:hypothetical protein
VTERPVPQVIIEFDVADAAGVAPAARELEQAGYELLHGAREEPWGQTVARRAVPRLVRRPPLQRVPGRRHPDHDRGPPLRGREAAAGRHPRPAPRCCARRGPAGEHGRRRGGAASRCRKRRNRAPPGRHGNGADGLAGLGRRRRRDAVQRRGTRHRRGGGPLAGRGRRRRGRRRQLCRGGTARPGGADVPGAPAAAARLRDPAATGVSEFCVVASPLPLVGGTAGPVCPLAIL